MADKKSFVMYTSWATMFVGMPEEQAGQLIKAICAYQIGREYAINDPMVHAVSDMIIEQMQADADNYAKECEKRSENAKKRWSNAKGVQTDANTMQKDASAPKKMQVHASASKKMQVHGDNEYEYESENEYESEKDGVSSIVPFTAMTQVPKVEESDLQSLGVPAELCKQVSEWIENRDAKGKALTEAELKSFVSMVKAKAKEHGSQIVADLIKESLSNGYTGVIWDKLDRNRGKPRNAYIDRIDHRLDVVDEWARSSGAFEEAQ